MKIKNWTNFIKVKLMNNKVFMKFTVERRRDLVKELKLKNMIVEHFIPVFYVLSLGIRITKTLFTSYL